VVPTINDDVVLNNGANVSLSTTTSAAGVAAAAGSTLTFTGGGHLVLGADTSTFAGTLALSGSLTIGSGSVTISGTTTSTSFIDLAGHTLTNTGTWTLGGAIDATNNGASSGLGGTFDNKGTIDVPNNVQLTDKVIFKNEGSFFFTGDSNVSSDDNIASFLNTATGVFEKQAGTGGSQVSGTNSFNNQGGTVAANTGTLTINSGVNTGGTYNAQTGAILSIAGHYSGTYTGSGGGTIRIQSSNSFTVDPAGVTLNFPAGLFNVVGGTLDLAGNTLTNAGTLTIGPGGSTGAIVANDMNTGTNLGGTLLNNGTIVEAGNLNLSDSVSIQNNSVYDFTADGSISTSAGTSLTNTATGTFEKTGGTGNSSIGATLLFNNQGGTVSATSGTLQLGGGTSTGGTYNAAAGAAIDLTGGTNGAQSPTFTGTYTGSGAGTVEVIAGQLQIGGGGASFNFPGNLLQFSGNGSGDGTFVSLALGDFTNLGTLNVGNGGIIFDNDGTLFNQGSIITNNCFLSLHSDSSGSTGFVNEAGATFTITGDNGGINIAFSGQTTIDNEGTIIRTATGVSAGTTTPLASIRANGPFTNNGTIEVDAGRLYMETLDTQTPGSFALTSGTWEVTNGASFVLPTTVTTNGATLIISGANSFFTSPAQGDDSSVFADLNTNTGTLELLDGATITAPSGFTNSGTLTLGPASTMSVKGNLAESGTLDFQLGGSPASGQFGSITVTGAVTVGGTLKAELVNGYTPGEGDTFSILAASSVTGSFTIFDLPTGSLASFSPIVTATGVELAAVTPSDLSVQSIDSINPITPAAGQSLSVNYTVENLSAATTATSWSDEVFLSSTNTLSANAVLLGRSIHTGALAQSGSYQATVTAPMPGLLPGSYYVIVETDSQQAVADGDRTNNVLASTNTVTATIPTITLNGAAATGSIAAGASLFYEISIPANADVTALLTLSATGAATLLEAYDHVPTTADADEIGSNSGTTSSVSITGAQAGNYFLLVQGSAAAGSGTTFNLTVTSQAFTVQGISPTSAGNAGPVTIAVTGSQFTPNTTVKLTSGGTTLTPTSTQLQDGITLFATFDLTNQTAGQYTVTVTNGDQTANAATAFTVTSGGGGHLHGSITAPSAIRPTTADAYALINYSNDGTDDLPAPLLNIVPINGLEISLSDSNFSSNPIEVLAYSPNGPAGVLYPGDSGQIKVYISAATLSVAQQCGLGISRARDADTIDWADMESTLQPPTVSTATFNQVFANFTAAVGSTELSLQTAMDADASYLSQFGEYTGDLTKLLAFQMQQADDFGSLDNRFTAGAFGFGRTSFLDATATTDSTGNVTIQDQGLNLTFVKQTDGSYLDLSGSGDAVGVDGSGNVTLTDPFGNETGFLSSGKVSFFANAAGLRLTVNYSGGKPTGMSSNEGTTYNITTDANGQITAMSDSFGNSLSFSYSNQLLTTEVDNGQTTTFTYVSGTGTPADNAVASITNSNGTVQEFSYDSQGRVSSVSAAGGAEAIDYSYNVGERSATDALNDTSLEFLNDLGEIAKQVDALGNVTQFNYDSAGQLEAEVAPDGSRTTFTQSTNGTTQTITNALGGVTQLTNDGPDDALTQLVDPLGDTTSLTSNASGQTTSLELADGDQYQYSYNSMGQLFRLTNPFGTFTQYGYNSSGQVTSEQLSGGLNNAYTYDNAGNLTSASTIAPGGNIYTYNAAHQLLSESNRYGDTLAYTYNSHGQVESLTDKTGYSVDYQYNTLGQMTEVDDSLGNALVKYQYDTVGRLTKAVMSNGTSTVYSYDADGNVIEVMNLGNDGSTLSQFGYTYNSRGQRVSMTTAAGTTNYTYDYNGQLTEAALPTGQTLTYTYDANGNRVSLVDSINGTTDYSVNNVDQYTSVGGVSYTYNPQGDLVGVAASANSGGATYSYDGADQLANVSSGIGNVTYEYDAQGHLIGEDVNGQAITFLLNPLDGYTPVAAYNSSGSVIEHFVSGLGLVAQVRSDNSVNDYMFDGQGNTVDLTNSSGAVVNSYSYLPFGVVSSSTETLPNPFTFSGQYGAITDALGFTIMGSRAYDPAIGRFIQRDPLGYKTGETNLYTYADNDPLDKIDPTGDQASGDQGPAQNQNNQNGANQGQNNSAVNAAQNVIPVLTSLQQTEMTANNINPVNNSGNTFTGPTNQTQGPPPVIIPTGTTNNGVPGTYTIPGGFDNPNFNKALYNAMNNPDFNGYFFYAVTHDVPNPLTYALNNLPPDQQQQFINVILSHDPNDMFGPAGYGTQHFIQPGGNLLYTVDFENQASASAPAQNVTVTEPLDPNLDPTTFQFGDIGFGSTVIHVPAGLTSFQTTVDLPAGTPGAGSDGLDVDVSASFDVATGLITWTFKSIDPMTLDTPSDPLEGFLPPDATPPEGAGFVTYTVQPKSSTDVTGNTISAQANVVFDTNAPLATPTYVNTIDADPPSSTVLLPPVETSDTFPVNWAGSDGGGSGIASYDVFVSTNGGAFMPFMTGTTATSASFTGVSGDSYGFYSVATDNVGNIQATPTAAQATTLVAAPTQFISFDANHPATYIDSAGIHVTVTLSGPGTGQLGFLSTGNENPLTFTLTGTTAKSRVLVRTRGTGVTTLNDITVNGSLASFAGATADLDGVMSVTGTLGALNFKLISGNYETINIAGTGVSTVMNLGSVEDLALTTASPIRSLVASSWTGTSGFNGSISSPSIMTARINGAFSPAVTLTGGANALGPITIKGAVGTGTWNVAGNTKSISIGSLAAGSDLTFTGIVNSLVIRGTDDGSITAASIKTMNITGNLTNAAITTTGGSVSAKAPDIHSLAIKGSLTNSTLTVAGSAATINVGPLESGTAFTIGGAVTSLVIRGADDGSITAGSVKTINVTGSLTNAAITTTGGSVSAKAPDIHSLVVKGSLTDSQVRAAGSIATVNVGGMTGSILFAGVNASTTALPASAAAFSAAATITNVTVRGTSPFSNSLIAASTVDAAILRGVNPANNGTPFGLSAEAIKQLAVYQPKAKPFTWNSKKSVSLLATLSQDLKAEIV
jgi:RHS repeat-associated protein